MNLYSLQSTSLPNLRTDSESECINVHFKSNRASEKNRTKTRKRKYPNIADEVLISK